MLDREHELRKGIRAATSLPSRDFRIYSALLDRADWKSAVIPNRFQPRNIDALAREAGMSARSVNRSLDHLALHGWVARTIGTAPGRHGRAVAYALSLGEACSCKPARPEPLTGAERAQRFRDRRKQRQPGVTHEWISRQIGVAYNANPRYETGSDQRVCAEEGRDEGSSGWGAFVRKASSWD
jgi:predicted transcriptional regulator